MFNLLIILSLVSLIFMAYHLRVLRKHDTVLYRICQVRRDTIAFLDAEWQTLTKGEYMATRQLLYALNLTINNYKNHKCVLFNIRRLRKYAREYHKFHNQMNQIDIPLDGPIRELFDKAVYAFLYGFFAYTPLIRSEVALHILRMIVKAFPFPSFGKDPVTINTVDTMFEINKQAHQYGVAL